MDKETAIDYTKTIDKYGFALCGTLYPSQMEQLQKALAFYRKTERITKIEDTFTNLAFLMIVSDLIWQERKGADL